MANLNHSHTAGIFGLGFGIAFAILAPVLYGLMGFVTGGIGALLYNLLARWVGGFELELDFRPAGLTAPYAIIPPETPATSA
jgi:hypothetical protein